MKRSTSKQFLKNIGVCAFAFSGFQISASAATPLKPNIIFILTDQQSASMMSCAGNKWLKTPAMDYIAQNGVRFTRAYATNPVCSPSRVSMMTGRFASIFNDNKGIQVRENEGSMKILEISDEVKQTTIASYLKKAGYELIYGGKQHLPKALTAEELGFRVITHDERDVLAGEAVKEIIVKHDKPYYMVVSLINPHDICYMAIRDFAQSDGRKRLLANGEEELNTLDKSLIIPEGISNEEFWKNYCPPLPINFEPQKDEPKAINWLLTKYEFRKNARDKYTDNDWRMHRWAYCRLTEVVDLQIQKILNALRESGQEENTLVLFSSDHGDMDASHRLEHKSLLYEESSNIPFMAMWKGHIRGGRVDSTHLVSNGLDLLPTVCDYAGINGVADPRGRSLRPLLEGKTVDWRKTLGIESEVGKMIVAKDGFKYIQYDVVGKEENLFDKNIDPHEEIQVINDPDYLAKLSELRNIMDTEWFHGQ